MDLLRDLWQLISTPEGLKSLIAWGGLPVLTGIVFVETGLLIGFFLPGDSLLFIAGFLASPAGGSLLPLVWLNLLLISAAIVGDTVGYWIGRRAGPAIFNRPDSRFFRRDHLHAAHAFYEKHGGKTILLARFLPIVRTFAPVVAGAADMNYRRFVAFNVFGGIGWVLSMTLLGFFVGRVGWVQRNLEKAILLVILLSFLPIVFHAWSARRRKAAQKRDEKAVGPVQVRE
ncbi:MAG: VTT domain-containing protein [Planctomycetaceae bacterium]